MIHSMFLPLSSESFSWTIALAASSKLAISMKQTRRTAGEPVDDDRHHLHLTRLREELFKSVAVTE